MKRLSTEEKRRIQRREANAKLAFAVTCIFTLGLSIGVIANAAATPDELEVIDLTVKPSVYSPYESTVEQMEDYENEKITDALIGNAINLGEFKATAYCNCEKCCGEWAKYHQTRSGAVPMEGVTVAVDPDVIPLGSMVYVTYEDGSTAEYVAQDTGGAIKGNRIDIYFESHQDALEFGVQAVNVSYTEE